MPTCLINEFSKLKISKGSTKIEEKTKIPNFNCSSIDKNSHSALFQ